MSVVFASSTCDLNLKLLKKVGVEVVNLPYKQNTKKGLYNQDKFGFDEYYANMQFEVDEKRYLALLEKKFNEALATGQDVLFLTPNAKYDVSYKVVNPLIKTLQKQFENQKIEIVNCNNFGLGYGLIVYETGIVNLKGENIVEVVKFVNKLKKEIKTFIVPSTNANIKNTLTLVGGLIGVRPFLQVVNGELKVLEFVKGKKKILNMLGKQLSLRTQDDVPVAISCGKNSDEANLLQEQIETEFEDVKVVKSTLNPLLTKYFGDRTLLIAYHKKSRS